MTTAISSTHDALITLIETALPLYTRLPEFFGVEENNELYLTKGYALAYGAGSNSERLISRQASWVQEYGIFLINQIMTTDHDVTGRANAAKAIAEDAHSLFIALEENPTLSSTGVRTVALSTGGVELLEGDREKYALVELSVEVEFLQNLNC